MFSALIRSDRTGRRGDRERRVGATSGGVQARVSAVLKPVILHRFELRLVYLTSLLCVMG